MAFVENVKNQLDVKASHRDVIETDGTYALREAGETYGLEFAAKSEAQRAQNMFFWNEIFDEARIQLGPTRHYQCANR